MALFETTASAPALSSRGRDSSPETRDTIRSRGLISRAVSSANRLSLSAGMAAIMPRACATCAARMTSVSVASPTM